MRHKLKVLFVVIRVGSCSIIVFNTHPLSSLCSWWCGYPLFEILWMDEFHFAPPKKLWLKPLSLGIYVGISNQSRIF